MKSKAQVILKNRLNKIKERSFEEDDFKLILIEIRDYLKNESFLREVCDFVAHPKRNKGICHKRIDSRYAKQKFIKERTNALIEDKTFELNQGKPWSYFSDQILNYIDIRKIEKLLFEIIIVEGIEEIGDKLFLEHYKINKSEVSKIIFKYYDKSKGYYTLSEKITNKEYSLLDDLLKFIRGTITGKEAFNQQELEYDLLNAIERISKVLFIEFNSDSIKHELDDIVVCILCILHDAIFTLFDGQIAKSFLSIYTVDSERFDFCLMANADGFVFPVITTAINASNYIEGDYILNNWELQPIPWVFLDRSLDKKLILRKKEEAED